VNSSGRVLWVAATSAEVNVLGCSLSGSGWFRDQPRDGHDVLVTGVGMTATAYHLGRILERESYRLAVNIGLAGTFHPGQIPIGTVVEVVFDSFGDLGAEDKEAFLDVFDLGLTFPDEPPFRGRKVFASGSHGAESRWPQVSGVTVNTVHGHGPSIDIFQNRCDALVESMEGAAFFYSCALAGVPSRQIRAISNVVESRNRSAWKLSEALSALENFLFKHRDDFL
jgi:futalosine hydrolase